MNPSPREAYLETQIITATPQRLRLMLIEGALRRTRAAQAATESGDIAAAEAACGHTRDIVTELIAGIDPTSSPLAQQVLSIYMFLFSTLAEVQFAKDWSRLGDVVRVLEEERITWVALCEKMPERPIPQPSSPLAEERAPHRVAEASLSSYGPAGRHAAGFDNQAMPAGFSIDA
jgi:flagellar protein FliS